MIFRNKFVVVKSSVVLSVFSLSLFSASAVTTKEIGSLSFVSSDLTVSEESDSSSTDYDDIPLSYDHIVSLPDGGKIFVYITKDGNDNVIKHNVIVPPEKFNPLTASDEEIVKYGFQPRPTDSEDLKKWNDLMSDYKETPEPELSIGKIPQSSPCDVIDKETIDDAVGTTF